MYWILAAAILWGTTGTAQALLPETRSPLAVGALRLLIGSGALLMLCLLRRSFSLRGIPGRLIITAGLAVAAYQLCFFWAVSLTGVAAGTIVAIGSSPVFAGLLEWLVQKKRPARRWYLSTGMAVFGCVLLVQPAGAMLLDPAGIGLALGAGLAYASYALAAKIALPDQSSENITALIFCTGALVLLPIIFIYDIGWFWQPRGYLPVLHLGVFATALSYWLFARGLQSTPVSTAVTLSLAEPMTAGLLGIFFLNEQLTAVASCGLLLVLAALAVLILPSRRVSSLQEKNAATE